MCVNFEIMEHNIVNVVNKVGNTSECDNIHVSKLCYTGRPAVKTNLNKLYVVARNNKCKDVFNHNNVDLKSWRKLRGYSHFKPFMYRRQYIFNSSYIAEICVDKTK